MEKEDARHQTLEQLHDAEKRIEFLQILFKDAGKKSLPFLDNLRRHHSKLVKAWVAERKDQMELFDLPSYSPQFNPEERLNAAEGKVSSIPIGGIEPASASVAVRRKGRSIAARYAANNLHLRRRRLIISA